jgi:hypothetical protein
MMITPTANFTRPANTTAYTAADLVADNTTAGSVTPMKFSLQRLGNTGKIISARLAKSNTTATLATFNIHLFTESPVVTNGDNGAFAISTSRYYLGKIAVDLSSGAQAGTAYLAKQSSAVAIGVDAATIYGLIEAGAGYTPASGEVFEVMLAIES